MDEITLPEGCRLKAYGDDFLLESSNLTDEGYAAFKAAQPADIQARLLGWRRISRERNEP